MRSTIEIDKRYTETVALILCDYCSKSLVADDGRQYLPKGTYLLRKVEDVGTFSDEDKEFCSQKCLVEWCIKEKNAD